MTLATGRQWLRDTMLLVALTVLAAVPRALRISQPVGFAFDEVYYVPAARAYLHSDYTQNFEHPPLAKWGIAAGIKLLGDDPVGWRLSSLVAGVITVPLTWLLVRRLLASRWWASLAALLVATDGMLMAQSRTAILDSLLPPLMVGAALLVTIHLERHPRGRLTGWTVGAGVLLGAAVAVKWQAAPALAGVLLGFAITGRRDRRALGAALLAFAVVPALVYVASYAGHLAHGLSPGEWLSMQKDMFDYHREFRAPHPRDSSPTTWLWLQRPVSYGTLTSPGKISITMALGNPVLWWSFCASIPVLLYTWWRGRDRTVELVLMAWASLHLVWLIVLRPGFLFYLTPLVPFMAIGVTWTIRAAAQRWRPARALPFVVALAAVVVFGLYLPVWTYRSISPEWLDTLMLFKGWDP